MSSKARRPYLMGKQSIGDFYKANVRFLKEIVGKESEFEKPYEDEDYRKMHFDFPWPDWPPFPDFSFPPLPAIPKPTLPGCAIVCYEPTDCDEPIWCHPGIWCGADPKCSLCSWIVEGASSGFSPHPMSKIWNWGIDVWIDSGLADEGGKAFVKICMQDPCGNICCHEAEVTCETAPECPPEIAISWASGDLTVAQGDSVEVEVAGGLGPYSWEVSGSGFTMSSPTTVGLTNNVVADEDACGSATVTVTDFCGGVATGDVRCTTGHWVLLKTCYSCFVGGAVWTSSCATCGVQTKEYLEGEFKWEVSQRYEFYPSGRTAFWGAYRCGSACDIPEPPCSDPISCGEGTPCTGLYTCFAVYLKYYQWICQV